MCENNTKHLEFIQNTVTRMNGNSFQIKAWTITIVSALLAIYASSRNINFILVAMFPPVMFWFLDTYYLMQERKFRGLYNDVAGVSENPKELKPFEMRPDLYVGAKYSYCNVFFSKTILGVYLPILVLLGTLYAYLKWVI